MTRRQIIIAAVAAAALIGGALAFLATNVLDAVKAAHGG